VYPFGVPLSTWFSGHKGILGDTEVHKKDVVYIYVLQENPKIKAAPY
jgi:hypothetical protein